MWLCAHCCAGSCAWRPLPVSMLDQAVIILHCKGFATCKVPLFASLRLCAVTRLHAQNEPCAMACTMHRIGGLLRELCNLQAHARIQPPCVQAAVTLMHALDLGPACLLEDPRLLELFRWLVPAQVRVPQRGGRPTRTTMLSLHGTPRTGSGPGACL